MSGLDERAGSGKSRCGYSTLSDLCRQIPALFSFVRADSLRDGHARPLQMQGAVIVRAGRTGSRQTSRHRIRGGWARPPSILSTKQETLKRALIGRKHALQQFRVTAHGK